MARIYTNKADEQLIETVLLHGLNTTSSPTKTFPKYTILRLALARSLQIKTQPSHDLDDIPATDKSAGYALKQVTGEGAGDAQSIKDFDNGVRALLSLYHQQDCFLDDKRYHLYLQRHIRRGLQEIRASWTRSHDFISYFQQDFLSSVTATQAPENNLKKETLAQSLMEALTEIDVHVKIKKLTQGPRLTRCFLTFKDVNQFAKLKKRSDNLRIILGLGDQGIDLRTTREPKVVSLDIPRLPQSWLPVEITPIPQWVSQQRENGWQLPAWLGIDVVGHDFGFDLVEAPHLLIAGTTGSGKSVCLHSIITSLLCTTNSSLCQFALIDPKQVEFDRYEHLDNLYHGRVIYDAPAAFSLLEELVEEMEKRVILLKEAGVTSLSEGLANHRLQLPYIVVAIEELADLLMQSLEIETLLVRLAQKARATGIHLILATQRPDAKILTGALRTNIPGRIGLRVQKTNESIIILDEKGAEGLLGKGDMLVKVLPYVQPQRVHGGKIGRDEMNHLISSTR